MYGPLLLFPLAVYFSLSENTIQRTFARKTAAFCFRNLHSWNKPPIAGMMAVQIGEVNN